MVPNIGDRRLPLPDQATGLNQEVPYSPANLSRSLIEHCASAAWVLGADSEPDENRLALFRPMGGAFPPADRQPRDAVAGAVVSLPSSA